MEFDRAALLRAFHDLVASEGETTAVGGGSAIVPAGLLPSAE